MAMAFSDPILILIVGILIVVGGIIGLKLNPFLALLLAAFVVGIMTPVTAIESFALNRGMSPDAASMMAQRHIGERIALAFGNTTGQIGILIAMAAIIGKCMLESGSAERIVRSLLFVTGEKRAPMAFLGGSFFLGIPVFFDTVFYLMIPLAKSMAIRLGKNYLLLVLAVIAGAAMANSLVPPTPGPLFLISEMNIPIGMMMIGGVLVGLVTISVGYIFALWANKKWDIPLRDAIDAPLQDFKDLSVRENSNLPSLFFSLLPILIPLVFISLNASLEAFYMDGRDIPLSILESLWIEPILFLGEKNVAMIAGGLAALFTLTVQKNGQKELIAQSVQAALMSGGVIILITASGGAFGAMLQQTDISMRIAEMTQDFQMALIPLAFFITALVRTAQGSATVAMITASGILSGMSNTEVLEFHQLYLGLAIACGSKLIPWMNDSGFWIVCRMSNLTEKEALKTFSPLLTIMGIVGLLVVLLGAKLFPLV